MTTLRRLVLALLLTALAVFIGAVGTATAMTVGNVSTDPLPTSDSAPIELASTGFDITVPVVVGLSTLVVGIAFVSWAFLREARTPRRRH